MRLAPSTYRAFMGDAFARETWQSPGDPWAGFFSDDPAVAERFGVRYATSWGSGSGVVEVEVRLKNPVTLDAGGRHSADLQFGKDRDAFIESLSRSGHDGVVMLNTRDEGTVYIPLRGEQVTVLDRREIRVPPAPPR